MSELENKLFIENKVLGEIRNLVPSNVRVKYHSESVLITLYQHLNPLFDETTITLGNTIFVPGDFLEWDEREQIAVIVHEFVHVLDRKAVGLASWYLQYLFPQVLGSLSLFAVLAFWNIWFLASLSFLVAFLPWRSQARTKDELRGYTAALKVFHCAHLPNELLNRECSIITETLSGGDYYFCCKDPASRVNSALAQVRGRPDYVNTVLAEPFMLKVVKILKEAWK